LLVVGEGCAKALSSPWVSRRQNGQAGLRAEAMIAIACARLALTRAWKAAIGPGRRTVDRHASTSAWRALLEPCLETWPWLAGALPD
jgi:hypothetical protein